EAHEPGLERHDARSAVADDFRRDALQDLERHLGLEQDRVIVVAVDVDEAGRDGHVPRVDFGVAARGDRAEGDDALAADADVRAHAGRAAPVVHGAAADHDVVALFHHDPSFEHGTEHGAAPPSASAPSTPARSPSAGATMYRS